MDAALSEQGERGGAAIGRNGDCCSADGSPPQLNLRELRDELRRGVRFAQRHDAAPMLRSHESTRALAALRLSGNQDDALADELALGLQVGERALGENDDDGGGADVAAFLGVSIPTNQDHGLPLPHRAASFSGSSRTRLVPCSPPVPIPQTQWKRRNSMSTSTSSRSSSGSMLLPPQEHQYSRTQCEAQLWDEYWNYKLSLESRESFEASTGNQRGESPVPTKAGRSSSISQDRSSKFRTTSEASTEDTARDSSDEYCEAVETDVFAMDDF